MCGQRASEHAELQRLRVGQRGHEDPAGPQVARRRREQRARVGQVLERVPERDRVARRLAGERPRAARVWTASTPTTARRCSTHAASSSSPHDVEAGRERRAARTRRSPGRSPPAGRRGPAPHGVELVGLVGVHRVELRRATATRSSRRDTSGRGPRGRSRGQRPAALAARYANAGVDRAVAVAVLERGGRRPPAQHAGHRAHRLHELRSGHAAGDHMPAHVDDVAERDPRHAGSPERAPTPTAPAATATHTMAAARAAPAAAAAQQMAVESQRDLGGERRHRRALGAVWAHEREQEHDVTASAKRLAIASRGGGAGTAAGRRTPRRRTSRAWPATGCAAPARPARTPRRPAVDRELGTELEPTTHSPPAISATSNRRPCVGEPVASSRAARERIGNAAASSDRRDGDQHLDDPERGREVAGLELGRDHRHEQQGDAEVGGVDRDRHREGQRVAQQRAPGAGRRGVAAARRRARARPSARAPPGRPGSAPRAAAPSRRRPRSAR